MGQRKGLGIGGAKDKLYVTAIDAERGTVTVGPKDDLFRKSFTADSLNWVSVKEPEEALDCQVKIRHQHRPAKARVEVLENHRARITFHEAQSAVTPGQVAAFYDGPRLLAAGFIGGTAGGRGS